MATRKPTNPEPPPAPAIEPPGKVRRVGDCGIGGAMAQPRRRLKLSDDVGDATVTRDAVACIDALDAQLAEAVPTEHFQPESESPAAQL